jgi:hypothetical protein
MAIEQVQNLPQQYVTDLGVDYGKQLAGLTSIPLDTARLAPQVAAQDPLQTQAYNLAGSRCWSIPTLSYTTSSILRTTSLSSISIALSTRCN